MSRTFAIALLASLASLAGLTTGCGTTVTKNPPATQSPGTTPASPAPTSPAPSSPSEAGQVGDKFTITNGDAKYDVTLLAVQEPAQPASEYASVKAGNHLAAAQFRVTALTSTDENANTNATVTGSNEQAYTASSEEVTAGTNFASGRILLQPGSSLIGWVSFELPGGVKVTKVQWTPSAGLATRSAEWTVSSSTTSSPGSTPTATATPTAPTTAAPTTPTASAASPTGAATPGQAMSPDETVIAYFDAINRQDYRTAWNLGGKNTASSYSSFVSGFKTTSMVSVQILDVSGDPGAGVVTARLTTLETDGSTKIFEGTYTVKDGVIVEFSVHQVS